MNNSIGILFRWNNFAVVPEVLRLLMWFFVFYLAFATVLTVISILFESTD